jgi:hypothetical protein
MLINSNSELKKSSMAFELKNGEVLLISKEDIQEIAMKVIVEMCSNNRSKIYLYKDTSIEKCNLLYKIVLEQKDKMSEDVRNNYFKAMVELIKDDEKEPISLEDDIKTSDYES